MLSDADSRQLKIDLITGQPNSYVDFFSAIYHNLTRIDTNAFNEKGMESIYFYTDSLMWVFYIDDSSNRIIVNTNRLQEEFFKYFKTTNHHLFHQISRLILGHIIGKSFEDYSIQVMMHQPIINTAIWLYHK